ncbi:hypothetical protein D3C71_411370 [compost metagenome]
MFTERSVSTTGILAALASRSTVSQPDSTTGENAITSTFCAMYERMALIWFSCFCCASENLSSMPASLAEDLIDSVLAVRHSLSAPTCAKPSTSFFCARADTGSMLPRAAAASAVLRVRRFMVMVVSFLMSL